MPEIDYRFDGDLREEQGSKTITGGPTIRRAIATQEDHMQKQTPHERKEDLAAAIEALHYKHYALGSPPGVYQVTEEDLHRRVPCLVREQALATFVNRAGHMIACRDEEEEARGGADGPGSPGIPLSGVQLAVADQVLFAQAALRALDEILRLRDNGQGFQIIPL